MHIKWILILMLGLSACSVKKQAEQSSEQFREQIEHRLIIEQEDLQLEGWDFSAEITAEKIQDLEPGQSIIIKDPETEGQLRFWRDEYGKLMASCEEQDSIIKGFKKEIRSMSSQLEQSQQQSSSSEHRSCGIPAWIFWSALPVFFLMGLAIGVKFSGMFKILRCVM
jgi:hypothetical protein